MKIYKSKFYLCEYLPDGTRRVMVEHGSFETSSKAWGKMFEPLPDDQQDDPRFIQMKRKPEFNKCFDIKLKYIIKHPDLYHTMPQNK